MMQPKPLTDDEILSLVQAEYASAESWSDELGDDRERALDYYYGRPQGDEVEGRSQVVSSDVADVVEWMMPALIRTIASEDAMVEFQANDDESAKMLGQVVAHVIEVENDGFVIKHDTLKDGLLSKTGAVKWSWTVKRNPVDRDYQNLSEMELALLLQGAQRPGYEVSIIGSEALPQPDGSVRYNVRLRVVRAYGCVAVEAIPPEELRIPRSAKVVNDSTRYVAHEVTTMTRSDLVAMGVPIETVMELPKADTVWDSERFSRTDSFYDDGAPVENRMMETVEYVEHYVLADIDGDGIAERRLICTSGDRILRNEMLPSLPVACWSPFRIPHAAVGRSLADRVTDLQRIRTAILRGMMDNIYTVNSGGRKVAVPGQVNMDDLLTMRNGGVIRVKDVNALRMEPVEYTADKGMMLDEYLRGLREERTGVNRHNQGVNADALHDTATMGQIMIEQGEELKELILRLYAEFLLKPLYRGVADLVVRYQDEPMQVRVTGKMLEVDPATLDPAYGLKVTVGSGRMRKDAKRAALSNILSSQAEALQAGLPITTVEHLYRATADLTELEGFNAERYWVSPDQIQQAPKPEQVDPLVQAEQVKAESREAEAAARLQLQAAKDKADLQLQREKIQREDARAYTEMELKYLTNVPGSRV